MSIARVFHLASITVSAFAVGLGRSHGQSTREFTLQNGWSDCLERPPHESMQRAKECNETGEAYKLASTFGATVTDKGGREMTFEELQFRSHGQRSVQFPVRVSVTVPHVVVKNTAPHAVVVQSHLGKCESIAAGEQLAMPIATISATFFDASIPIGGAYWVRPAGANCSSLCTDCYWWWVDMDRPKGAFLSYVGYGAALPGVMGMLSEGMGSKRNQRPHSYGGIFGVKLTAHRWKMGDIDDGLTSRMDWDGGEGLVNMLHEQESRNMTTRWPFSQPPFWGGILKPYHTATVEILGIPGTGSEEKFDAGMQPQSMDLGFWTPLTSATYYGVPLGPLLAMGLFSVGGAAAVRHRRMSSARSNVDAPDAIELRGLVAA